MKKTPMVFIAMFSLLINSFSVYGANIVTANSVVKNSNLDNASIIASKDGEYISKMDSLESVYSLTFSNDNYITTKYAKVIGIKASDITIPVYKDANSSSQTLGKIPVGSIVVVANEFNGFSEILFNEEIGFINTSYLIASKPTQVTPTITPPTNNSGSNSAQKYALITSSTGLNLRAEPSTSSKVLSVIAGGTYAKILETTGEWLKVEANNSVGYVSKQFVTITDAPATITPNGPTNPTATELLNFAKAHLGKPYIYGSTNLNTGTDCSGFTYAVFKHFGINLNRVSRDQYLNGTAVSRKNILPGDLVFFNTGGNTRISHVGIYMGNDQYIHCTDSKNQGVIISSMTSDYAKKTYYGARRVIN